MYKLGEVEHREYYVLSLHDVWSLSANHKQQLKEQLLGMHHITGTIIINYDILPDESVRIYVIRENSYNHNVSVTAGTFVNIPETIQQQYALSRVEVLMACTL